ANLFPQVSPGDFAQSGGGLEAAVGPRHHAARITDRIGGALEAVSDNLAVFDVVGLGIDDAGDQAHVIGKREFLEAAIFVLMARVGGFQNESADVGAVEQRQNLGNRDIKIMRRLVVSPAHVHADAIGRGSMQSSIHRGDVQFDVLEEISERTVGVRRVPLHREVWAIDLQNESLRYYVLVLSM